MMQNAGMTDSDVDTVAAWLVERGLAGASETELLHGACARCKPWIVPIPGTTKLHRLEENLGAAAVQLTADDMRDIEAAAAKIHVRRARGTPRSSRS